MERGYLIAALAMCLTFAGLTRGYHSLEHLSLLRVQHWDALGHLRCPADAARREAAKIRTRLHPRSAEEAQLLAEMNLPTAAIESSIAEQMMRQDSAIAQCARAKALREAERASREAARMQEQMARTSEQLRINAIPLQIALPRDFERIQQRAAVAAARIAKANVALRVLSSQEMPAINVEMPTIDISDEIVVSPKAPCKVKAPHAHSAPPAPPAETP